MTPPLPREEEKRREEEENGWRAMEMGDDQQNKK